MSSRTSRRNLVRKVKSITRTSGMASLIAGTNHTSGSRNAGKTTERFFSKTPQNAKRRKELARHVKRFRFHPATGGSLAGRAYERFKKAHGH